MMIMRAFAAVVALAAGAVGLGGLQAQAPADVAYPGSKLTRTEIEHTLLSADPGTKPTVDEGRAVYDRLCAGCHIFGDTGQSVGPDLTTVASRFQERDILRSILWPSETISDQYTVTVVDLGNGRYESGLVFREDARYLYLKNNDHLERPLAIPLGDIQSRDVSTASLMPDGLVAELTLQQIDSLVAFLLTGK
jgi:putative heme-binding domain-containing protein